MTTTPTLFPDGPTLPADPSGEVTAKTIVKMGDGGFRPAYNFQFATDAESTTVYAPVPKAKDPKTDVHQPKAKDSPAVAQWRVRMKSDEAKALYKDRASTTRIAQRRPNVSTRWHATVA